MLAESPFHEGERAIQQQLGVEAIETWARQVIRPYLPDQHRAFHTALPFLVAAARDEKGRPWATLLTGDDGFVHSPDDTTLVIEARPAKGDALEGGFAPGADLGLLGIELHSRRRNRVNGRVGRGDDPRAGTRALVFEVDQSFGNCPQYIHERAWERVEHDHETEAIRHNTLTPSQRQWIERADTLFISSGHRDGEGAAFGMDASHRGGDPGFVRVEHDRRLVLPDYAGNNHFNTLGNLVVDPRVGLLFVDFDSGALLQLTGRAEIIWDGPEVESFEGAHRLVAVEIDQIVEIERAVPLRWRSNEARERTLEIVDRIEESAEITSFLLRDVSGRELSPFEAGQFLPIELDLPTDSSDEAGVAGKARRTYSLSNGPDAETYRISVKRESMGLVSRTLHDRFERGHRLRAQDPTGDFVLPKELASPLVFISAGVGVTPLLSMLHELARRAEAGDAIGPISWIHGARDGESHAFREEVRSLAERLPHFESSIYYSQPHAADRAGLDYDHRGRIEATELKRLAARSDGHYLLCGPTAFMSDAQETLLRAGVAEDQIHSESFGPAAGISPKPLATRPLPPS